MTLGFKIGDFSTAPYEKIVFWTNYSRMVVATHWSFVDYAAGIDSVLPLTILRLVTVFQRNRLHRLFHSGWFCLQFFEQSPRLSITSILRNYIYIQGAVSLLRYCSFSRCGWKYKLYFSNNTILVSNYLILLQKLMITHRLHAICGLAPLVCR